MQKSEYLNGDLKETKYTNFPRVFHSRTRFWTTYYIYFSQDSLKTIFSWFIRNLDAELVFIFLFCYFLFLFFFSFLSCACDLLSFIDDLP